MKTMIGKAVPKRFRRNARGMPTRSWFASSPKIVASLASARSASSMVDSRTSITTMSKASLALFNDLRLSCSFE